MTIRPTIEKRYDPIQSHPPGGPSTHQASTISLSALCYFGAGTLAIFGYGLSEMKRFTDEECPGLSQRIHLTTIKFDVAFQELQHQKQLLEKVAKVVQEKENEFTQASHRLDICEFKYGFSSKCNEFRINQDNKKFTEETVQALFEKQNAIVQERKGIYYNLKNALSRFLAIEAVCKVQKVKTD